jgi:hypothetical protein
VAAVILAREEGKPVFLLARAPVPGSLGHLQRIDVRGMSDAAGYERLLSGLDGLATALGLAFAETGRPMGWEAVRARIEVTADGGVTAAARGATGPRSRAGRRARPGRGPGADRGRSAEGGVRSDGRPRGARALLALLLAASGPVGSPIVVLATLRSDCLNAFQRNPAREAPAQRARPVRRTVIGIP